MKRRSAIILTTAISMASPLELVAEADVKGAPYKKQDNNSPENEIVHTVQKLGY